MNKYTGCFTSFCSKWHKPNIFKAIKKPKKKIYKISFYKIKNFAYSCCGGDVYSSSGDKFGDDELSDSFGSIDEDELDESSLNWSCLRGFRLLFEDSLNENGFEDDDDDTLNSDVGVESFWLLPK